MREGEKGSASTMRRRLLPRQRRKSREEGKTNGNDLQQPQSRSVPHKRWQYTTALQIERPHSPSRSSSRCCASLRNANNLSVLDDDLKRRFDTRLRQAFDGGREEELADVDEMDFVDDFGPCRALRLTGVEEIEPIVFLLPRRVVIRRQTRTRRSIPPRFLALLVRWDRDDLRLDELHLAVDDDLRRRGSERERVRGPEDDVGVVVDLNAPYTV
jgi:hypothetical protein